MMGHTSVLDGRTRLRLTLTMFQSKKRHAPLVLTQQSPNHHEDLMVSWRLG